MRKKYDNDEKFVSEKWLTIYNRQNVEYKNRNYTFPWNKHKAGSPGVNESVWAEAVGGSECCMAHSWERSRNTNNCSQKELNDVIHRTKANSLKTNEKFWSIYWWKLPSLRDKGQYKDRQQPLCVSYFICPASLLFCFALGGHTCIWADRHMSTHTSTLADLCSQVTIH